MDRLEISALVLVTTTVPSGFKTFGAFWSSPENDEAFIGSLIPRLAARAE